MAQKIIKAAILGLVFGGLGYLLFQDISTAFVCGLIMVLSMFVTKK